MAQPDARNEPVTRYRIKLRTHLDAGWLSHFPVVTLTAGYDAAKTPVTMLVVGVQDQAELMGMLMELHGMGLALLSVQTLAGRSKGRAGERTTATNLEAGA
jgi:hypothetical protein